MHFFDAGYIADTVCVFLPHRRRFRNSFSFHFRVFRNSVFDSTLLISNSVRERLSAMQKARFLFLSVILWAAASCGGGESLLFLEYCIPIQVQTQEDAAGPQLPLVGVVLNYASYASAPLSGTDAVQSFVIATEVPVSIFQDETLPTGAMVLRTVGLAVVDALSAGTGHPVAARVAFSSLPAWAVPDARKIMPAVEMQGVLGGDVLRKFAVRFFYGEDRQCSFFWDEQKRFWPNILLLREQPATAADLADDGYAVVPYQLGGGGQFIVDGALHDLPATRVTVQVCMNPDPFPLRPDDPSLGPPAVDGHYPVSGVDMFALVATGTPYLLTTEGGFERIRANMESRGQIPDIQETRVLMPEGAQTTRQIANVARMAVIGGVSSSVGACAELARRRGQEWARRNPTLPNPYFRDAESSGAAVAEVDLQRNGSGDGFPVAEVDSSRQYWQGLWAETLPDLPQIDLVLGHPFLRFFEFTVDYPQSRMMFRCLRYNCSSPLAPCCRRDGTCTCPLADPCCQYYHFKR